MLRHRQPKQTGVVTVIESLIQRFASADAPAYGSDSPEFVTKTANVTVDDAG